MSVSDEASVQDTSLRTVGATKSAFEREYARTRADPFAGLGDPDEGGVVTGELLGAGGMGEVRAGVQMSLRRQVAVKRTLPRDDEASDPAFATFLREAWITAQLDHPNVIPVHALSSERGQPQLVMKLVDGVAWRSLLVDDALATAYGMRDRIAFHLEIFGRICRAVHFAHARGIVHLDLKPTNVMVGHHGEVYLFDWGIAASFRRDAAPWLPRTVDIDTVGGTPAYLSPEQAGSFGSLIGPRTDVFLLGALIHFIVLGRPPHRGESLEVVLNAAYHYKPPAYGSEVPDELAAILRKAMARSPDDRHASAEELRLAVLGFLRHRESNALLDAALVRLDRLTDEGQAPASSSEAALAPGASRRIENECRFGIDEARRSWPENPRAAAASARLARVIVERSLRDGDWRRAAAAMERLPAPDEALWERVQAQRADERNKDRERRALQDLGTNQDILRHARVRSIMAASVSAAWIAWFVAVAFAMRSGLLVLTHPLLCLNALATLALYSGVMWKVRDSLMTTQIDRRAILLLAASLGGVAVLWGLCWTMGIAPLHTVTLSSGVYMFFFVAITMVMERRLAWVTVALAPLAFVSFFDPAHTFEWQGASVLLGGSALCLIWRHDARVAARRAGLDEGTATRAP